MTSEHKIRIIVLTNENTEQTTTLKSICRKWTTVPKEYGTKMRKVLYSGFRVDKEWYLGTLSKRGGVWTAKGIEKGKQITKDENQ